MRELTFQSSSLPKKGDDEQVRLVYSIADEGDKVFINQIVINGVTGRPEHTTHQAQGNQEGDSAC